MKAGKHAFRGAGSKAAGLQGLPDSRVKKITQNTTNKITANVVKNETTNVSNDLIQKIGDSISHGEGNYESYDTGTLKGRVVHSYLHPPSGSVTSKTINQILDSSSLSPKDPNRMFATGKYQTIPRTLKAAKDKMGLTGDDLYDATMQERVFKEYLIEKAGGGKLADFALRSKGTVDSAILAASKEWASIAVPAGLKTSGGLISDGTLSYYESAANHANQQSTAALRKLLESVNE